MEAPIKATTGNNLGRPTLYKPEYNDLAYNYCLLGATDKELAIFFDVEERTIDNWKESKEGFFQSIKRGREEADANVANRLYKRATGYEHEEDVIMQYQGQPVIVKTTKHYAPDTAAAAFWLKNRRPDRWRERVENVNVGQQNLIPADQAVALLAGMAKAFAAAAQTERNVTPPVLEIESIQPAIQPER